ncbi:MAG: hypothetical protein I3J02_07680 [Prevotella sp.]|nr:hypothetical protein [Prevotella sp.]
MTPSKPTDPDIQKALAEKLQYAGKAQPSMKRRSSHNDYTDRHTYMVTLVIEGRRPLLGHLEGDVKAPSGTANVPRLVPSALGRAVIDCWERIPEFYPKIGLIALQLMPDHLHGILMVGQHMEKPLGAAINGFKRGCTRAYRQLLEVGAGAAAGGGHGPYDGVLRHLTDPSNHPEAQGGQPKTPASNHPEAQGDKPETPASNRPGAPGDKPEAPSTQPQQPEGEGRQVSAQPLLSQPLPPCDFSAVTHTHPERREGKGQLFEIGYNDKILLEEGQMGRWLHYLADNPRRLMAKRLHPDLFRVQRGLTYAGMTFSAIGNRWLLTRPKLRIQCSRRLTEEQIQADVAFALRKARLGRVLVSPRISPGEKAIIDAAFAQGYPIILLQENGFTDFAKPGGRYFDACAAGRMLILAPWSHHNEAKTIQRTQCMALNDIARLLCDADLPKTENPNEKT